MCFADPGAISDCKTAHLHFALSYLMPLLSPGTHNGIHIRGIRRKLSEIVSKVDVREVKHDIEHGLRGACVVAELVRVPDVVGIWVQL